MPTYDKRVRTIREELENLQKALAATDSEAQFALHTELSRLLVKARARYAALTGKTTP